VDGRPPPGGEVILEARRVRLVLALRHEGVLDQTLQAFRSRLSVSTVTLRSFHDARGYSATQRQAGVDVAAEVDTCP
jgi:hypothetical protein